MTTVIVLATMIIAFALGFYTGGRCARAAMPDPPIILGGVDALAAIEAKPEELAPGIPRPETIMAALIATKILRLEPHDGLINRDFFELELSDGREVEVRRSMAHIRSMYSALVPIRAKITVGLPGAPAYRTIELTEQEQKIIDEAICQLYKMCRERKQARIESESRHAALEITEGLLLPEKESTNVV